MATKSKSGNAGSVPGAKPGDPGVAARAAQQKKSARAPQQQRGETAPGGKPSPPGKPIWDIPHAPQRGGKK